MSSSQAGEIRGGCAALCLEVGPQALAICESFGLTDAMLSAPIARDWVGYNEYDNQGEMSKEEELLKKRE